MRSNIPGNLERSFQAYFPYTQYEYDFQVLLLRSPGDPSELMPALRKVIASIDPAVPIGKISTLNQLIAKRSATRRLATLSVSIFSGAALFLAAVGLYAVLAYSVSQRKRELSVRIALGAQTSNILRLVIRQGLQLFCCGLIFGIVLALILVRFIDSILYGVSGSDPITLGLAVLVLGTVALLACLLPAIRATRIDPITALRE